jgi:hypothetical protein
MSAGGSYLGDEAAGREADHSLPSSAKVKNSWSYTSTPRCVLMAWCLVNRTRLRGWYLVKHRYTFTYEADVRIVKSRRVKWSKHVARMGKARNVYEDGKVTLR